MVRFGSGGPNSGKRGYGQGGTSNKNNNSNSNNNSGNSNNTNTNTNDGNAAASASASASGPTKITSSGGNDASWAPPLWLTKEKQAPRPRSLTIPIPPVELATRQAVVKAITRQRPPHYKQQAQLQQLQVKIKGQQDKLEKAQQRLKELEANKTKAIQEFREKREAEMEAALQKIQTAAEKEHADEMKKQEEEWKEIIERERKAAKRQFKKDQVELEEKELEAHQIKVVEAEAQHTKEKEQKLAQASSSGTAKDNEEAGATSGGTITAAEGATINNTKKDEDDGKPLALLPSQLLEREHKKIKGKLDNLKETKKEMVWLLKRVINAENKRKASETPPTINTTVPKKKLKL